MLSDPTNQFHLRRMKRVRNASMCTAGGGVARRGGGGKSGAFPSFATEASELCFKVLLSTILFFLEVTTVAKIVSCDYSPSTRPSLYCRRLKVLS